jgi:Fe-S cluster assembly protein SufD
VQHATPTAKAIRITKAYSLIVHWRFLREISERSSKQMLFKKSNNILLSDKATINAKPQLEIFADDVKCSHGCTIGQLDETAMFYMQQRGIPKKEASVINVRVLKCGYRSIKIPELKQRIKLSLLNWA